ncbi:prostatic acid phosphatase-like isoform X2 [Acanthaster planci]|uniref:Prostatic acid phosphatase-like isoform X2 n=1 Tax=Acanthaster planci TaxID=133434 RepID=A0A8B7ZPJ1_ACAPL|nr:prostatic acid phosphatase-like isoform X2 [Acanthaster planci]
MAAPIVLVAGVLTAFSLFDSASSSGRTLKLTHVIFRHGNRSPIQAYPTDPYQEDSWPQGFGQLTQEGMRQHYDLGQWFRQRYVTDKKLLNSSYIRAEIKVRSTAYDRTLMSAQSNLAGLYPPEGWQVWKEQLAWQPIPIFTEPLTNNFLLVTDDFACPRLKELRAKLEKWHNEYISKNQTFFNYLAEHAGFDPNNVTYYNFTRIADSMQFELADGRTLPLWATKKVLNRLLPLQDFSYSSEAQLSDEYFRLCSGGFVSEIVTHLKDKIAGTDSTKMYMYSAHDDNVAWALRCLNVFNNLMPPTASCLLIELYQEGDKSYTVDVLFKNNTKEEPLKLRLPGTSGQCTVDHFFNITQRFLLTDVSAACKAQKSSYGRSGFLPKTWNTGFLTFSASGRAFQWLLVLSLLTIVVLLASIRKGCKFLRNLNNNFKLRVFATPTGPNV